MSNMIISVSFLSGTSLVNCLIEAQEKAVAFNVAYIDFKFNGIEVSVSSGASIDWGSKGYWDDCMERGDKVVVFF